ncbi:MAG: pyridoxamine kinase [Candidatus Syntrophosphaera sp.]|jgi:pyridoxine kinase|nr:pyridoxamine kinase [Candidatus Cloacimonadota bacterium]MDY0112531.1 pyridoxamine kinase [Candidatus Syntrophosphaera sp.]
MMENKCKRILTIQDFSGFGHTSLMAYIPIMYRLGIRVCALPSAYLSANTDYPEPIWIDMSSYLEKINAYWQKIGFSFDAISSGFLASPAQVKQIGKMIASWRDKVKLVLIDPVMGDYGKLYSGYDQKMIGAMRELIGLADIITPNYTEACWLAKQEIKKLSEENEVLDCCRKISEYGPSHLVVTSVPNTDSDSLKVMHYDAKLDKLTTYPFVKKNGIYPGAGDCFSALLLAGLVNGYSFNASIKATIIIISQAIEEPMIEGTDWREGLPLEKIIDWDLKSFYSRFDA